MGQKMDASMVMVCDPLPEDSAEIRSRLQTLFPWNFICLNHYIIVKTGDTNLRRKERKKKANAIFWYNDGKIGWGQTYIHIKIELKIRNSVEKMD